MMNVDTVKKHLLDLAKQKPLEQFCTNCGDCCRVAFKVALNGVENGIIHPDLSCKFLKEKESGTNCSVYHDRFNKAPWCNDTVSMIVNGLLPSDCPYVKDLVGYVGKVKLPRATLNELLPIFKFSLRAFPTDAVDHVALKVFLEK